MSRRVLTVLGALALLFTSIITGGTAHANTPPPPTIDFWAMQQTCSVIHVQYSGSEHTITCSKARKKGVQPSLGRDNSCNPTLDNMVVYTLGYAGVLCFEGYGYLGVGIYDVNEVDDVGDLGSWFRYYNSSGGFYHALIGGGAAGIGSGSTSNVTVTQLCYQQTNWPSCS